MSETFSVFRSRFLRLVMALLVAVGAVALVPAAASAAPGSSAVVQAPKKVKVKHQAKKQNKVKKGAEFKVEGNLEELAGGRSAQLFGSVLLQSQTSAGLWVNLGSPTQCRPNGTFTLALRVETSLTLRVFAPATTVYAEASSSAFAVIAV
ncbi:hypothetical protein JOF53_004773 [Crossiella equi]|uniref:Secreted protein n=1 Tax=Crossiella equi TaxID=130796 RepID=A0ABS5AH50_9PSEU|nr:hypothetical protein [Crossiella equi]MBP2475901.1 hypothetical protein [Crossiella equi]